MTRIPMSDTIPPPAKRRRRGASKSEKRKQKPAEASTNNIEAANKAMELGPNPTPKAINSAATLPSATELTPTQLHNARKRRSKQKKRLLEAGGASAGTPTTGKPVTSNNNDPSSQFLKNPRAAPIVVAAKRFFTEQCGLERFEIYQHGPKIGWRTVSKLPVRQMQQADKTKQTSNSSGRVVIGMFQPQSHQLQAQSSNSSSSKNQKHSSNYPAHHPSINAATTAVALACQEMGVDAYDETTGNGYLRYIAMNVERTTGRVQMTLIWNDAPYEKEGLAIVDPYTTDVKLTSSQKKRKRKQQQKKQLKLQQQEPAGENGDQCQERARGKGQLERLSSHLLNIGAPSPTSDDGNTTTTPKFVLHSLWVHYNASWKHSNAIFDTHIASPNAWYHAFGPKTIPEQLPLLAPTTAESPKKQQNRSKSKNSQQSTEKEAISDKANMQSLPTLHFAPNVFRQANLDAFAQIVAAIRQRIQKQYDQVAQSHGNNSSTKKNSSSMKKKNKKNDGPPLSCIELYGGVGTIGLHLLDLPAVASLLCSDENPYNRPCFDQSISSFPKSTDAQKATYIPKNASDMIADAHTFLSPKGSDTGDNSNKGKHVMIVDPPRKGLDDAVLAALVNNSSSCLNQKTIQLLVYVSCGFDAFQRDYQRLTETGLWKLEHAEGHVLFPGSNAIETLAYFAPTQI